MASTDSMSAICFSDKPRLQIAMNQKVYFIDIVILHVGIGGTRVSLVFEIVKKRSGSRPHCKIYCQQACKEYIPCQTDDGALKLTVRTGTKGA